VLLVDFRLVNQTHQGEALVHFSQVEHNVFLVVCMRQLDDAGRLLVKLGPSFLVIAVYTSDIDEDVDQLTAYFIVLHVHGRGIGGDVDLGNHIEQEGLLDL